MSTEIALFEAEFSERASARPAFKRAQEIEAKEAAKQ